MQIRIRKDVTRIYSMDSVNYSYESYHKLELIAGKTLEVETDYLFDNQFNTTPIEGVSETGLRIMEIWVDKIIDDAREGKCRCNWCGKSSQFTTPEDAYTGKHNLKEVACCHCEQIGYLQNLTPRDKRLYTSPNAVWRLTLKRVATLDGEQYIHLFNANTQLSQRVKLESDGTVTYNFKVPAYVDKGVTKALKNYYGYNRR